jgi:hypothetical protein
MSNQCLVVGVVNSGDLHFSVFIRTQVDPAFCKESTLRSTIFPISHTCNMGALSI